MNLHSTLLTRNPHAFFILYLLAIISCENSPVNIIWEFYSFDFHPKFHLEIPGAPSGGNFRWTYVLNCPPEVHLYSQGGPFRWRFQVQFQVEISGGNFRWKFQVDISGGNFRWKFQVEILGGNFRWKFQVEISGGNFRWKFQVHLHCWLSVVHLKSTYIFQCPLVNQQMHLEFLQSSQDKGNRELIIIWHINYYNISFYRSFDF